MSISDDDFDDIARQVAERLAAAAPPARPHVPLAKLGQPPSAWGNGHDQQAAAQPWWAARGESR